MCRWPKTRTYAEPQTNHIGRWNDCAVDTWQNADSIHHCPCTALYTCHAYCHCHQWSRCSLEHWRHPATSQWNSTVLGWLCSARLMCIQSTDYMIRSTSRFAGTTADMFACNWSKWLTGCRVGGWSRCSWVALEVDKQECQSASSWRKHCDLFYIMDRARSLSKMHCFAETLR